MQKQIIVSVEWTGDNYCAGWSEENKLGVILVAHETLEGLKKDFAESLVFSIEGWVEDGEDVPAYLLNHDYKLRFDLNASALLHEAMQYTTLAAISRASGINQRQLSHYANGLKHPRPAQRARIAEAVRLIGSRLTSLE